MDILKPIPVEIKDNFKKKDQMKEFEISFDQE